MRIERTGFRISRERRITEQLLLYWDSLRRGRVMPSREMVNANDLGRLWDDCLMIRICNDDSKAHIYEYIGDNIQGMFGGDVHKGDALPFSDMLDKHYEKVVQSKKPLVQESCFDNLKGEKICYRQILLPLSENGGDVDFILGGMRYKLSEKGL